ncbi:copper resistance CopC family protein [Nonomuraea zeae]|uniref:copper resistance CopC family protein n=1 Tax=Nonomuraea zeae TaxID=1642303 RepID=UPI001478A7A2|nr:copper resistance protein CopC [Nonomuraea zeae]
MHVFVRRAVTTIAGTALLLLHTAPAALAHDRLKASSPADHAKVKHVATIELEFTADMRLPTIVLDGPGGKPVPLGKPRVQGRKVSVRPAEELRQGHHRIAWRVVSSDGHPIQGEIAFTVTEPPATTSTPTPTSTSTSSPSPATVEPASPAASPPSPAAAAPVSTEQDPGSGSGMPGWLWAALALMVAAGAAVLVLGRRKESTTTE